MKNFRAYRWTWVLASFFSLSSWAQSYNSAWNERGASNKFDSVVIEFKNRKVKVLIPKDDGSFILFEGKMPTDLNRNSQYVRAYTKVTENTAVSPKYLEILKAHPPRLIFGVKEEGNSIVFDNDQVDFFVPKKNPETPFREHDYPYVKRNTFVVQRSWVRKAKTFEMRDLLDSDSHYGTGMVCGLIDGLVGDVKMLISVQKFVDQNTLYFFGDMQLFDHFVGPLDKTFLKEHGFVLPKEFSAEAVAARAKQREIAITIGKYLSNSRVTSTGIQIDPELVKLGKLIEKELSEMLSEWIDEFTGSNTSALQGYNHGKILYNIITMFIGVREVALLLKGGQASVTSIRTLKKIICFTGDTPVHTNRGKIAIEKLHIGIEQFESIHQ